MCDFCLAYGFDADGSAALHDGGLAFAAEPVSGDGAGLPSLGGAGAAGQPLGVLDADRRYAVATAVNSAHTAMDKVVGDSTVAAKKVFTFRLETTKPADMPGAYSGYTLSAFTAPQDALMRSVLADIETLINVDFVDAAAGADADISIMRGNLESNYGGRGRFTYFVSNTPSGQILTQYDGFAIFNETRDLLSANNLNLIYHEIGHALTLRHPGNVDINPANAPPPPYLPTAEDNYKFSIMSYNTSSQYPGATRPGYYMLYDVEALQYRFGANYATRAGDDTYLSGGAGYPIVIWDGGGNDTLDGRGYSFGQYLDLRGGAFSTLGSASLADTLAIAYRAVIENAYGGPGADTLQGNDTHNALLGGEGNDVIRGGKGNDYIDGGGGFDILDFTFATGRITISLGETNSQPIGGGEDNDTVRNIERVIGSAFDDILFGGGGADELFGGAGVDWHVGMGGNDVILSGASPDYDYAFGDAGQDVITRDGDGRLYARGGVDNDRLAMGDALPAAGRFTGYLFGDDGDDTVLGGAGDDVLVGSNYDAGGNAGQLDALDGGAGADYVLLGLYGRAFLNGGAGNDTIVGGGQADTLWLGAGDDFAYGGGGGDVFRIFAADLANGGTDQLIDFYQPGSTLELDGISAGSVFFSNLPVTVGGAAYTFGVATIAHAGGVHTIIAGYVTGAQLQAATTFL